MFPTFYLILTIVASGPSSITSVPFYDGGLCQKAADVWLREQIRIKDGKDWSAICVPVRP